MPCGFFFLVENQIFVYYNMVTLEIRFASFPRVGFVGFCLFLVLFCFWLLKAIVVCSEFLKILLPRLSFFVV